MVEPRKQNASQELYWHFLPIDKRLVYGSREVVEVGKTLSVDGELKLCHHGFHMCVQPLDALNYAQGALACRVYPGERILTDTNKIVSNARTIIWMADATKTLQDFARWCALEVIHLWKAPDIVKQFLETGDESLRSNARAAAGAAARAAAAGTWDAARDATWAATRATSTAAAWDAAARDAARAAAGAAARGTAWPTTRAVSRDAAWDRQNTKLTEMLGVLRAMTQPKEQGTGSPLATGCSRRDTILLYIREYINAWFH